MPEKTKNLRPANSSALSQLLSARIRERGPLSVAEYMETALGHPEHGYYILHESIGADGDFITAPEVSQMFGEMIGAWLVDIWLQSGRPERVKLVELGPGRGTLAADVMRTVSAWPEFRAAATLHLVETSPRLRQAQFEALKSWNPTWYDRLDEVPGGFTLIIANEFFDALPVRQFEKAADGWRERMIDWHPQREEFFFTTAPLPFDIAAMMPEAFLKAPTGSVFELNPAALSVLEEMCRRIEAYGGAGLVIDYGHAAPGLGETLQAVSKHEYSNALENPGLKDITAHVDFGTLRAAASARVHGPVTQGAFLNDLGILQRAEKLAEKATDAQRRGITAALHRLTSSAGMGGLFKVMALTPRAARLHVSGFGEEEEVRDEDEQAGA